MADAKRDNNVVTTLLAVSNVDGITPVVLWADPTTHRLLIDSSGGGANTALSNLAAVAINAALLPGTSDSIALGSATKMWSDLFLGDAAVINFNNGDVTVTHATNNLLFAGASSGYTFDAKIYPTSDDGAALGDTTHNFSDIFLASGAVINVANSNWVATHTSGILTVGTGDLRVTTAGTNAASVVTVGGAQTLTSKVLTAATITTSLVATTDDGAALGDATHNFSDLFLASGALLNFANGNAVITHSSGILTVSTGDLRVTTAGTNTASVVTVGGTQTLTSKTLTSPVLNTATIGTSLVPTSNDGAPLGNTTNQFSDLFLAEGGVINWDNGDLTLTQTNNELVLAGGNFDVGAGNILRLSAGSTVQLTVPTSDGTATGPTTSSFVSGYTSSAIGDLVYLDSSGKWQKTDADSTTTSYGLLGIALAVAATDAALLVALPGAMVYATAFPTLTIGATYYISETAGAISASIPTGADNVIRVVGFGIHADKLLFLPSSDVQTTVA